MASQRSEKRVVREKFRKRSSSWFRKGNELAQMTGADIYIVMRQGNKYYTYKSTDRPEWPPSEQDILNYKPPPFRRSPKDFETLNERDEDDDDDDEGRQGQDGRGTEDRGQKEESEAIENPRDQGRRIFTIPKVPVLQRMPTGEGLRRDDL